MKLRINNSYLASILSKSISQVSKSEVVDSLIQTRLDLPIQNFDLCTEIAGHMMAYKKCTDIPDSTRALRLAG